MSEVITPESVPEVPLESTPEGASADESQISLEKLNEFLGKEYKDVDTALKSVKDTFSFVGKRDELREGLEGVMKATNADETTVLEKLQSFMDNPQVTPGQPTAEPQTNDELTNLKAQMQAERAQYAEDRFFDKNPEMESVKNIIKPLKQTSDYKDMSWDEFKGSDVVKNVFETYSTAEEAQSKKSVVESNPRLGAATDKMNNARQAQADGNDIVAKENAVGAVVDLLSE